MGGKTKGKGWGRRTGWLLRAFLVLAILGVLFVAAWTMLLPGIAVSTIQARTGFTVKADKISVNPFTGKIELTGVVMQNPAGWPVPDFLVLRHFKLEAELLPLLRNRLVADELVLDVERLSLVRNRDGQLNAEAFRQALANEKEATTSRPAPDFLIRRLVIKFDRLTLADYSGRQPSIKDYYLQVERELADVDSVAELITPFLGVMFDATRGLFDVVPGKLGDGLNGLQKAGKKTGESLKNFFQSLEKEK